MESSEVLNWIGSVIAALVAGGLVVKFVANKTSIKTGDLRITTQSNNKAGGDIIAGDSVKNADK